MRSTWPRGSVSPTDTTPDVAVTAITALIDPSSPDVIITDTDGTTGAAPAPSPGESIAPVSARAFGVPHTSVSDAPPITVGISHQGVTSVLAPSEHIASVSDGRPARVCSVRVTSTMEGRPPSSANTSPSGPGSPNIAGPHRDTGAGGGSTPHFPRMPSLAADNTTMPVASAATILTASPSLGATVDTTAGATAIATSTADVRVEFRTDPVPITTVPPTAEHISSFLSCIRRRVAGDTAAAATSAIEAVATPPSSNVNTDATDGAAADAASGAAVPLRSSDTGVSPPPSTADDTHAPVYAGLDVEPTSAWGDDDGITAATAQIDPAAPRAGHTRKRRKGPADALRQRRRLAADRHNQRPSGSAADDERGRGGGADAGVGLGVAGGGV